MADAPAALYPKSGVIYLMSEVQRLTENLASMIDVCVWKDQRIAALEAELAQAKAGQKHEDQRSAA